MGKIYFPRLVMPISAVLTGLLDLVIQVMMMAVIIVFYICTGTHIDIDSQLVFAPLLILQVALLGLGCRIIIAACTTKYRDLAVLVSFGVQLWMYASPVVYATTTVPERFKSIYMCNPMAPIISSWRYSILGTGEFPIGFWGISWSVTIAVLFLGIILFSSERKK